tara:strand:- start:352 stop:1047 length:696 start_codon:yes stop_codon:yes gene_type:complete
MAKQFKLNVEKRESIGKSNMRDLRRQKKIPGVYYSYDSSNILFQISESEIRNAINSKANIFSVSVGDKEQNVIFKSVQYHPVTDDIIHIDLYGVDMNKPISIKIPIHFIGTAVGVQSEGGVLITSLNELEISCLPSDIPENIELDISNVELGANLQAGDVILGEKFELVTNADATIVSVTQPMVEEEPVVEDELEEGLEGEEGAADGEGAEEQSAADGDSTDSTDQDGADS